MATGWRAAAAREWDTAQDFSVIPAEQWELLRDRMQQRHDEAMEDRRRIEDGAHRAAVFSSGLATVAFGLAQVLGEQVSWLTVAAIALFGGAAALAFWNAGTARLPAMHRLSTLVKDVQEAPDRFTEFEARDLMISSEEIRDAMEPVARWLRMSRCLVVLGVFGLVAEVIATSARPAEDQTSVVQPALEAAPPKEPQASASGASYRLPSSTPN